MITDDKQITRIFTTNTQAEQIPVSGLSNVGVFATLAGVTGGTFSFEGSINGSNWFAVSGFRTDNTALENATGALSATPAYGWQFDTASFNFLRIRATAGTFGTATFQIAPGEQAKPLVLSMFGVAPRGSASPGAPLYIATARNANIAGLGNGTNVDLWADLSGKLITKDFAPAELDFRYLAAADATPFSATTATQLVAAVATYRNYITAFQAINVGATATEFVLQDSTATPVVLFRTFLPANMTVPVNFPFPSPLRSSGGTASRIDGRCVTAGASIYMTLQGFVGL